MADARSAYEALCQHWRRLGVLGSVGSVLGWDQQCMLPAAGAAHRAEQGALIAELRHAWRSDPRVGEWLAICEDSELVADPLSVAATDLRGIRRSHQRAVRVREDLVVALSRATSEAFETWKVARAAKDFARFAPALERVLDLVREQADQLGWEGERYDALLDGFEPGMRTAEVEQVFAQLAQALSALHGRLGDEALGALPPGPYPLEAQAAFGREVSTAFGFDYAAGRLDPTIHPFCSRLGPGDVRLTTRYDEADPIEALDSTLHEAGHGLYEQGLPGDRYGLPSGSAVGLGIHESQSRLWQNHVGRSRGCCRWLLPRLRAAFPGRLDQLDAEALYRHLNSRRPERIRVDADETSYDLHVILRFELERELLDGGLAVRDLPAAWNQRFEQLTGLAVRDDAEGVLQDVHWSHGMVGYFPTYTLGNCYAAQFMTVARHDLGDLDAAFERGDFAPLLAWLRAKVHAHGQRHLSPALCREITGSELDPAHLIAHLEARYLG